MKTCNFFIVQTNYTTCNLKLLWEGSSLCGIYRTAHCHSLFQYSVFKPCTGQVWNGCQSLPTHISLWTLSSFCFVMSQIM